MSDVPRFSTAVRAPGGRPLLIVARRPMDPADACHIPKICGDAFRDGSPLLLAGELDVYQLRGDRWELLPRHDNRADADAPTADP